MPHITVRIVVEEPYDHEIEIEVSTHCVRGDERIAIEKLLIKAADKAKAAVSA